MLAGVVSASDAMLLVRTPSDKVIFLALFFAALSW
jgi:hypothetical protein